MKRIALASGLALGLFALAACPPSQSQSQSQSTTPPPTTGSAEPPPPPPPPPADAAAAQPGAAAIGEPCGPGDACQPPSACVTYYGIAGPRGPQFKSCEIRCDAKGQCADGRKCITIADGPGQVCR